MLFRSPDPATREALARVIRGTAGAGHKAYISISNHAEGCAPLSVRALAQALVQPLVQDLALKR